MGSVSVYGRKSGLTGREIRPVLKIYSKHLDPRRVMTPEFGAALCRASVAVKRPVSVLVNKKGGVAAVFIGDSHEIDISSFFRKRREVRRGMRNYRLVGVRAGSAGLDEYDKFTLINERLEMIGIIKMTQIAGAFAGGFEFAGAVSEGCLEKWKTTSFDDYRKVDVATETALGPLGENRKLEKNSRRISGGRNVFLVGIGRGSRSEAEGSLEELKALAVSAGKSVAASKIQMRDRRQSGSTVLGERNLRQTLMLAGLEGADEVVFDTELTPSEASLIQSRTDMKIVDRTQLILEIFSLRATSKEGKIQVKLAELQYALPRLSGKGIQMSQPGAGIGTRGPGEKTLEKDRRRLRRQIKILEKNISAISARRSRTRENLMRRDAEIISLMGYTNAGKSTLFSALSKQPTDIADRMFSTLGTKTRKIYSPSGARIFLTDTVGFIKDLPQDLMTAFRATLEELGEASALAHVCDSSDPLVEDKMDSVNRTVASMGFGDVPKLTVFAKTDKAPAAKIRDLSFIYPDAVFVSALKRKNIGQVVSRAEILIKNRRARKTLNGFGGKNDFI